MIKRLISLVGTLVYFTNAFTAPCMDVTFPVFAEVGDDSTALEFSFSSSNLKEYEIFRIEDGATSWGNPIARIPNGTTEFIDTTLTIGQPYNYRICSIENNRCAGNNYVHGGIRCPAIEKRGTVLLLVDSLFTGQIEPEINRLTYDLIGDGWKVVRRDVSSDNTVPGVKRLIQQECNKNPSITTPLIFGHLPVPYSGNIAPDGHTDNKGAWPADAYYADLDGEWTDSQVNNPSGNRSNVPGDGKFDQNYLPSDLELEFGRVDVSGYYGGDENTIKLAQRYLEKHHKFRHGQIETRRIGLIDDNFFSPCGFTLSAWQNFYVFFGRRRISIADYFTALGKGNFIWSYGAGGGSNNSAGGIGSTGDFKWKKVQTIFTMLFGSNFGYWDKSDNFLRAPLISEPSALTCFWAGTARWHLQHMNFGHTIGYSMHLTFNNNGFDDGLYHGSTRDTYVALMGDPTLRMHIVVPPSNVRTGKIAENTARIQWEASPDTVVGYHIYRAPKADGTFERINDQPVTEMVFDDTTVKSGKNVYMVRAIKLEKASGSYYNLSQGIFDSVDMSGPINVSHPVRNTKAWCSVSASSRYELLINMQILDRYPVEFRIIDILGRTVYSKTMKSKQNTMVLIIPMSLYARGLYFLHVNYGERKLLYKLPYWK